MATVQFRRETPALVRAFAQRCGQGIHGGFRLHCRHTRAPEIYDLIPRLVNWSDVTGACGGVVVRFGLARPNMERSNNSCSKLGWLLARRSLQVIRSVHNANVEQNMSLLYEFIDRELGFGDFRLITEPLADDVIARMITPWGECPDCRIMLRRKGRTCEFCGQPRCPIHCQCSSGEKRARRKKG